MIRLSVLQFRAQAATAAAALAVFAVILAATSPHLFGLYDSTLAAMATAGLFSLLLTWWSGPVDTAAPFGKGNSITFLRLGFVLFPTRGITPLGYAAFAFALGGTAGVLIRRTVPAMAATLAAFLFIQIAWPVWVRPHLIPPAHAFVALNAANIPNADLAVGPGGSTILVPNLPSMTGDWILSTQNIDPAGHPFDVSNVSVCQGNTPQACDNTLSSLHLRAVISYQPAGRFWALQLAETGIFLAAALALAGFCFWTLRRHRLSR